MQDEYIRDGFTVFGYSVAQTLIAVLRASGDKPARTCRSKRPILKLPPGITAHTSAKVMGNVYSESKQIVCANHNFLRGCDLSQDVKALGLTGADEAVEWVNLCNAKRKCRFGQVTSQFDGNRA
jgi:hypothetical protein